MHTYPWHVGDYLRDCAHLSDDEDLAYRRLLDMYYSNETPIPDKTNWVAKRIRMVGKEAVVGSVLKEFFERAGGFWHQKRCDEEIAKYQRRANASRENGRSGGRPAGDKPTDIPAGSGLVATRTRTRTKNKTPLPPEGERAFESFWQEHPRKVGKPKTLAAFAAAVARGAKPEDILAGLRRHLPLWAAKKAAGEGEKIPHPTTWLNRDGWNDEVMPGGGVAGGPAKEWHETRSGVEKRAGELGITAWCEGIREHWPAYLARVMAAHQQARH